MTYLDNGEFKESKDTKHAQTILKGYIYIFICTFYVKKVGAKSIKL